MSRSQKPRHPSPAANGRASVAAKAANQLPSRPDKPKQTRVRAPSNLPPDEARKWRRDRASSRELRRIHEVASATDVLRKLVPRSPDEDKPPKVKLLRQAAEYIAFMGEMLDNASQNDSETASDKDGKTNSDQQDPFEAMDDINSTNTTRRTTSLLERDQEGQIEPNIDEDEVDRRSESTTDSGGLIKLPMAKRPRCLFPISPPASASVPSSKNTPLASATTHLAATLERNTLVPQATCFGTQQTFTQAQTMASFPGHSQTIALTAERGPVKAPAAVQTTLMSGFPGQQATVASTQLTQQPSTAQIDLQPRLLSPMQISSAVRPAYAASTPQAMPVTLATTPQNSHTAAYCLPHPGAAGQHGFTINQAQTPVRQ